jgi:putative transposase
VTLSSSNVADLVRSPPVPFHHHSARGLALLSSREVERLLIERSVEVFYETVCRWVLSPQGNAEGEYFGPAIARNLQHLRPRPSSRWQLNVGERISGRHMYLCQAVDEGEVLDVLVQRRRYKAAARKLMRKLLN